MISSTRSETSFRGAAQNPLDRTQGDAFAEFMLGTITLVEDAVQIDEAQFRSTSFALYFDDTWKITPKLTQTLGLRYENAPPWEDRAYGLEFGTMYREHGDGHQLDFTMQPLNLRAANEL